MELSYAPLTPWIPGRLPGMSPLEPSEWLHRDAAFAPQMAYRDRLLEERGDIVLMGEGCDGAGELLDHVLATIAAHDPGYRVGAEAVTRPDGVTVPLDRARPLATLGRLVQEDLLVLHKEGAEHVLAGAVLIFPSRWSLAEKFGRPLVGIHERVPAYDEGLAPRVQRLFDALKPGRPMVRANYLVHPTPELHQPKLFTGPKKESPVTGRYWLRVERQSILRLAESGHCVFSVKTLVTPIEALTADQRASLADALEGQEPSMRDYHGGADFQGAAVAALRAA
mgnify:CR=1 FL=1